MALFSRLTASLDTTSTGFSGRKISTAVCVLTAVYIATMKLPEIDRIYAVYAFLIFSAICLGLVTIPDLIKFLSAKTGTIIETTKTEVTKEKTAE